MGGLLGAASQWVVTHGCVNCNRACSRQLELDIAFRIWDRYVFDDQVRLIAHSLVGGLCMHVRACAWLTLYGAVCVSRRFTAVLFAVLRCVVLRTTEGTDEVLPWLGRVSCTGVAGRDV